MILGYTTQTYNSKLFQAHTGGVYNKANSRICLKQEKPHKPQSLQPKKMGRSKALVCASDAWTSCRTLSLIGTFNSSWTQYRSLIYPQTS